MTDPFWTFIPQKLIVAATNEQGILAPDVTVSGWFSLITVDQVEKGPNATEPAIVPIMLTPADQPVTLKVPAALLPKKNTEELSTQDIIAGLNKLFSYSFNNIPSAPQDTKTSVPPSKRKAK